MTFSPKNSSKYKPEEQIELLKLQCKKLSPKIYELKALYLQYLRSILTASVRQAVYFLVTDQNDYTLNTFSIDLKLSYFQKIDLLVSKTISFLTIEHLMHLAHNLEEEESQKLKKKQESLNIQLKTDEVSNLSEGKSNDSITLNSVPQLDNPNILNTKANLEDLNFEKDIKFNHSSLKSKYQPSKQVDKSHDNLSNKDQKEKLTPNKISGIDMLKKIFNMSDNYFKNTNNSINNKNQNIVELDNSKKIPFLPENPSELLHWENSLDIALKRVLRDLSNSINIELIEAGILNSVIPVSLLDAVVDGQILTQDSPSNLLRLSIPINSSLVEEALDINCILLRPSEFEFDFPKLRQYRSLLKENRNILVKMIKQHRHWQNRLLADDVSQQWLQSPQEIQKANKVKD